MSQWLDLGNQSQACITIPESCGMGGGTISAWVKRDGNHAEGGVISSMTQVQTSFTIVSHNNNLRYTADYNVFPFYLYCSNLFSIVVDRILYNLKILANTSPFCGGTDASVLDFWWCCLWVSKPKWAALFMLSGGICVTCSGDSSLVQHLPTWQPSHSLPT